MAHPKQGTATLALSAAKVTPTHPGRSHPCRGDSCRGWGMAIRQRLQASEVPAARSGPRQGHAGVALGVYWGYIGILENRLETTTVYWVVLGDVRINP